MDNKDSITHKFDLERDLKSLDENPKISDAQNYIKEMYHTLGWTSNDPRDRMLFITEEVGELAHAVRKNLGYSVDLRKENNDTIEDEVADVFITLCALCNAMEIDLGKAFLQKQAKNCKRTWTKPPHPNKPQNPPQK